MTADDHHHLYRRTLVVVAITQALGGAGISAGVTVGALLAKKLIGGDSLAGLPVAVFTIGSAVAALLVGAVSQRAGRRPGLATGFLTGAVGGVGVIIAAATGNVVLLLASFLLYGAGTATNLLARYAGTDLAPPAERGRALSVGLFTTTFGAVAGPNLAAPLGRLATSLGLPALSGPFLLSAAAYALAGLAVLVLLRPDPLLVAREHAASAATGQAAATDAGEPVDRAGIAAGVAVMVLTQLAMVAVMTMTPVHMREHHHGIGAIGFVISMHIAAMFLPSPLSGALADRFGRIHVAVAAAVTLLAAGIVGALAPGDSMVLLTLALVLLGLGWNFGLVSGTALIVDSVPLARRASIQGRADVSIALSGSGGAVMSGMVVAGSSYAVLAVAGGLLSLLLIPFLLPLRQAGRSGGR